MKITLIGTVPPYKGGVAEFNAALIKELKKEHQVQVISWKRQYPFFAVKEQMQKGVEKFEGAEFVLHYGNPFSWREAVKRIKEFRSEIVIIPWLTPLAGPVFTPLMRMVKRSTNAKTIALCHNVLPHEKTVIDRALSKVFFSQIDEAMVHSGEDEKRLKEMKKEIRVKKAFHPLYEDYPVEKEPAVLKELDKPYMLFFGFVRPYKGLKYLLEAMPLILKEVDRYLLIAGEFWEDEEEYLDLIRKLKIQNSIKLVGNYIPREEVGSYFKNAEVVILPYISGTQSGIIQTAYHFNKPVICTNVGGFAECVIDEKTGFVVEEKNPEALAKAVIRFYKEKRKEEFEKNIEGEKKKYSWSEYCKILVEA